jgi:Polyketide cyclase / dehydrase and lipid transport
VIALLASIALAAPPPFIHVDQVDSYRGCTILIGPQPPGGGVSAMRAVCHWPDVTLDAMRRVLSNYEGYGRFIDVMTEVKVVRREPGRVLVWQFDRIGRGLSPRESQTWMTETAFDGGFEITWTSVGAPPFTLRPGCVLTPHNEGYWYVTAAADGGVDIVEHVAIDPGGAIPTWVVNWFQTYATADQLRKLHDLTAK